jgi:hypothetical protein
VPASYRPPQRSRQQWLLSAFLFGALILMSFLFLMNPSQEAEKKYADAQEVPLSTDHAGLCHGKVR